MKCKYFYKATAPKSTLMTALRMFFILFFTIINLPIYKQQTKITVKDFTVFNPLKLYVEL